MRMVKNAPSDEPERKRSGGLSLLWKNLPLEHETSLYLLVSALDLFMTYLLLRTGKAVEANPIARFFLHGWGIRGMIYFKFALAAFVCLLVQGIALKKPRTAQRVLQLAIFVVGVVVVYSLVLYLRLMNSPS